MLLKMRNLTHLRWLWFEKIHKFTRLRWFAGVVKLRIAITVSDWSEFDLNFGLEFLTFKAKFMVVPITH